VRTLLAVVVTLVLGAVQASAFTLTFETEDDFATALINGQIVDPVFDAVDLEFGNLVNISSTDINGGHGGVTVFDSTPGGVNAGSADPDLLVGLGNILILQNGTQLGTSVDGTVGLVYNSPNDEQSNANSGSILFDFLSPIEVLSIDVIDANGGFLGFLILTDDQARTRTYTIPEMWTDDIFLCGGACVGFATLDLTTLSDQTGESGVLATVVEDAFFDSLSVISLDVQFVGNPSSGGIDNLVFTPEPSTGLLIGVGLLALGVNRRRQR
jgi:hypothetical protein